MKRIKISDCRSCPFVLFNEVTGYDGCSMSDEISDLYTYEGNMPKTGVHELCPIRKENEIIIELHNAVKT
jgi:hypothetical protein